MKKEKLFGIVVVVGVLGALYGEGWIGAVVFIFVYAIGRLVGKMAYRKSEDPLTVLIYISMACLVFSLILSIILDIREGIVNYYAPIITIAWSLSVFWRKLILKTE